MPINKNDMSQPLQPVTDDTTSQQTTQSTSNEPTVELNIENTKKDEAKKQPINVIEPILQQTRTTEEMQKVGEVEKENDLQDFVVYDTQNDFVPVNINSSIPELEDATVNTQQAVIQKELDLFTQEIEKFLKNHKVLYNMIKDGEQDIKGIEATAEEFKIFLQHNGFENNDIVALQAYFSRIERHFRRQDLLNTQLSFSSIAGLVAIEFEGLIKPVIDDIKIGISNIQKNAQNLVKLIEDIRQNPVAAISDIIVREVTATIQFVTNVVAGFVRDLANMFDFNINLQIGGVKISVGTTDAFRSDMEDIFGKGSMEPPSHKAKQSFWIEKKESVSVSSNTELKNSIRNLWDTLTTRENTLTDDDVDKSEGVYERYKSRR